MPVQGPEKEIIIQPSRGFLGFPVRELWSYRDLFLQFVRRDYASKFKQTLLGPLWFVLQPLLMTAVFTVVFGRLANLPTDGVPPMLFYLCGLVAWNYFAQSMPVIAGTFTANTHLFNKVYFPRLTVPLSILAANLFSFLLQLLTFAAAWLFFRMHTEYGAAPCGNLVTTILLLILAQAQIMLLSLGVGTLFAAATGKYRDLQHVLPVLVQLWFYATPVVYPLSMISKEAKWYYVAASNPMTAPVEAIKLALLGHSSWSPSLALISWSVTIAIALLGLSAFGRAEKTVIDVA